MFTKENDFHLLGIIPGIYLAIQAGLCVKSEEEPFEVSAQYVPCTDLVNNLQSLKRNITEVI